MSIQQIVRTYLTSLRRTASAPHATEHSYRPAIEALIENLAQHLDRPLARLTPEPGHVTAAGAPDVALYGSTDQELIGYLETKDLGKDLDNLTGHDLRQFNRYRAAFPAWVLTNYLDFRLYQDGQMTHQATLGHRQQVAGATNLGPIVQQKAADLAALFDRFLQMSTPQVAEAGALARLLAHKARLLEGVLLSLLTNGAPDAQLSSQLEAYRHWLIPDLTAEQFADFYAQTLAYGLFFAAFENSQRTPPQPFARDRLLDLLPMAVRPVRAIFQMLAARFLPAELDWIVDDLVRLLARADLAAIAGQLGQSRDPTVHFYETFLSQYDPALREMRGVYYTPDEVVGYIVRSIDRLLRRHFDQAAGLASAEVTLLDPALGTGTFLAHALRQVAEAFGPAQAGDLPDHLRQHTLKKWHGFELLAAPYVLAHLKLSQVLESLGVADTAPQVYLTNTLGEHTFPATLPGPFEQAISQDGRAAQRVKAEEKILVILGNPPYSGHSFNAYARIDDYKFVNGQPLAERNLKWLQNDYVKFIRWAEWKIAEAEQAGYRRGIVAFITDHSYLTGLVHRGMRAHLLDRFSRLYILNLHGNSRISEPLPPGVDKDENVFDIQQGVAIGLFMREASHRGPAQVFYADLWGARRDKYDYLAAHDVTTTEWTPLQPDAPFYFLVQRKLPDLAAEYSLWPSITDILGLGSMGIVTGQDDRAYAFDEATLRRQLGDSVSETCFRRAAYRPFDERWLAYEAAVVTRRREDVMQHLFGPNLALVTFRHTRRLTPMRVLVSRRVVDARLLSSESNCYAFPLYRYTNLMDANGQMELNMNGAAGREPNLHIRLLPALVAQYAAPVTPEEIFDYLYGVLNAPGYQAEAESLLQVDFPRIPFAADYDAFCRMAERGRRLVALHLLEASDLQSTTRLTVGYPIVGDNRVERGYPQYDPTAERVYINPAQYFSSVAPAVWSYRVGSYNPLEKWLQDRRERTLSLADRRHYETFATAIGKALDELPHVEAAWQLVRGSDWFNPLT